MVDLYLLEQLLAFESAGTLSGAAAKLHLSQPALTRSMKKLEEALDVSLFIRENSKIRLNEVGKTAVIYARRVLDAEAELRARTIAADRALRTITIGAVAPGPLMELTPLFTDVFSNFTVATELKNETALLEGLSAGTDQMILLTRVPDDPALFSMPCGSEHLYASLIPSHPLAQKSTVALADCNGENFLVAAQTGVWENIIREKMPDSTFIKLDGNEALREVVDRSVLSGFCTDVTLRVLGNRANRVNVPFTDPECKMNFYCVCLKDAYPKYERWYEVLKERYPSE